mgnify:CR=1 FL=1
MKASRHAWVSMLLLVLFVLMISCSCQSTNDDSQFDHLMTTTLQPNTPLFHERIEPNGGRNCYKIQRTELAPATKYEVRVSYSAIHPAYFRIETVSQQRMAALMSNTVLQQVNGKHHHRRKLLNIEKIVLDLTTTAPKSAASVPHEEEEPNHCIYVCVTAKRESHSFDPSIEQQDIIYDIVVERLLFGAIPQSSVPLLFIVLFALVIVTLVVTYSTRFVTTSHPKRDE